MNIDVFNGDADGIFSLIQLRKAQPISASQRLVTGVKRDISLVKQISDAEAENAAITVLDISFDKNTADIARVLAAGASVMYCDHHQAKTLFTHDKLHALIDTAPTVCTALLINEYLQGAQALWAVAAAYGDGLDGPATALADKLGLTALQKADLKQLGVLVNYNGYGAAEADLFYAPADLYKLLLAYDTPFAVIADKASPFSTLLAGYEADLALAQATAPVEDNAVLLAVHLADTAWSRRISGTYGNILAAEHQNRAIVIATTNDDGTLTISLRAPKNKPYGAAEICGQFPTGGGREGAAGINSLPNSCFIDFCNVVRNFYKVT